MRKGSKMKKAICIVLIIWVIVAAAEIGLNYVLDGMLFGTYEYSAYVFSSQYTFAGKKVYFTQEYFGVEVSYIGSFEITKNEKGEKVIVFDFEGKGSEKYSGARSFEMGEDYVVISGNKYYLKTD